MLHTCSCGAQAPRGGGIFCCRVWPLGLAGLRSCSPWTHSCDLQALGLSYLVACEIFPDQELNALAGGFLITGTPGKSLVFFFFFRKGVSVLCLARGSFVMETRWKCLKRDI